MGDYRMGLPGCAAGPGQEPPPADGCDACRPRPRHGGASACHVADGRAGRLRGRLSPGAGCMRCNESGWLPGQARDVANDAAARRVPCSCGAGRAALTGTADDAPDATGCTRMHHDASRRNDDACRATVSAASSLHQIQADHEVPGHHSRTALWQAGGRRNAARCAAGSACSREVPNDASDATPRPFIRSAAVWRRSCIE